VYGTSKLALNHLTFCAAHQLGESGITVNSIAPGIIDNEATRSQMPDAILDPLVAQLAVKRRGTPDDLYSAIRWLCSDEAGWMSGQTVHVNGGQFSLM
jgi:NAD(P)-dependent dehydrogenase (short-subunit alcohol dehydrogenase family)